MADGTVVTWTKGLPNDRLATLLEECVEELSIAVCLRDTEHDGCTQEVWSETLSEDIPLATELEITNYFRLLKKEKSTLLGLLRQSLSCTIGASGMFLLMTSLLCYS
jgi:hypothetical protein